jgi:hypothetical protein
MYLFIDYVSGERVELIKVQFRHHSETINLLIGTISLQNSGSVNAKSRVSSNGSFSFVWFHLFWSKTLKFKRPAGNTGVRARAICVVVFKAEKSNSHFHSGRKRYERPMYI